MAYYTDHDVVSVSATVVGTANYNAANAVADFFIAECGATLVQYAALGQSAVVLLYGFKIQINSVSTSSIVEGTRYTVSISPQQPLSTGSYSGLQNVSVYLTGHQVYSAGNYVYTYTCSIRKFNLADGEKYFALYSVASSTGMIWLTFCQAMDLGTNTLHDVLMTASGYYWDSNGGNWMAVINPNDTSAYHYMVAPLWTYYDSSVEILTPVLVGVSTAWYQNQGIGSEPSGLRYVLPYHFGSRNGTSYLGMVKVGSLYYVYYNRLVHQLENR